MKPVHTVRTIAAAALVMLSLSAWATAQTPDYTCECRVGVDRPPTAYRRGDLRTELAEKGYSFGLGLTYVYQANVHGGLSTHRRKGRHVPGFSFGANFGLEKIAGLRVQVVF